MSFVVEQSVKVCNAEMLEHVEAGLLSSHLNRLRRCLFQDLNLLQQPAPVARVPVSLGGRCDSCILLHAQRLLARSECLGEHSLVLVNIRYVVVELELLREHFRISLELTQCIVVPTRIVKRSS